MRRMPRRCHGGCRHRAQLGEHGVRAGASPPPLGSALAVALLRGVGVRGASCSRCGAVLVPLARASSATWCLGAEPTP